MFFSDSCCIDSSELAFLHSKGIDSIRTTNFTIHIKQTLTGLKLVVLVEPSFPSPAAQAMLSVVYSNYTDYALKDPFYLIDMPIRCSLFDKAIRQILAVSPA
jgi:hypothetical protein